MLDTASISWYTGRKGQWLRSALCHHFSPDPCVDNEILVLSTGIDQYLQEIFHHLAFNNSEDVVFKEDFTMLCLILGISTANSDQDKKEGEEVSDILTDLPCELNFREFHARLCGHFSLNTKDGKSALRLPVTEETELIEREIRVRWPRFRRRKCVSFDLSKEQRDAVKRKQERSSLAENRTSADWSHETGRPHQQLQNNIHFNEHCILQIKVLKKDKVQMIAVNINEVGYQLNITVAALHLPCQGAGAKVQTSGCSRLSCSI